MPSTVNSQITDAVTDSSRAMPAGVPAPPVALGSIYQSLAHATGILFENAVAAQQQQNTLAQAAANQGVMQIYSLDTTAAAGATRKTGAEAAAATDGAASLATTVQLATVPPDAAHSASVAINGQIEHALQAALKTPLHSGDVAYGVRAAADALAAAIDRINRANHENLLRIVQLAGVAACLAAMVREPDKADAYQSVLQAIQQLD